MAGLVPAIHICADQGRADVEPTPAFARCRLCVGMATSALPGSINETGELTVCS
jgi:hypothetical protein